MLSKPRSQFKAYLKNNAGGIAVTWALSMMAVTFAVGATYDMAQITKAKQRAQMVADSMALTASIAVNTENKERYNANQRYSYDDIGNPGVDFTKSMVGYVVYDVVDDLDPANKDKDSDDKSRLLARATVEGVYQTAFLSAFGYDELSFSASADVSYAARKVSYASVFFVTDNSESMINTDIQGTVKLNALKKTLKQFMVDLNVFNTDGEQTFRTALFPYEGKNPKSSNQSFDGLIKHLIVNPHWGTLTNSSIDRMKPKGFTDSSGALEISNTKFKLEAGIHKQANGEDDPQKYLVFMTDGLNNPVQEKQCKIEKKWKKPKSGYWTYNYNCGKGALKYGKKSYKRPTRDRSNWKYYPGKDGYWRNSEKCTDSGCKKVRKWVKPRPPYWKYYPKGAVCGKRTYSKPRDAKKWKFTPGKDGYWRDKKVCKGSIETNHRNEKSLKSCSEMKQAGVQIYTIAYDVEPEDKERAEAFMRECSSGTNYFKYAKDAAALEIAFKEIGASIVKDVVRLKR